jgi:3-deoxy-D-manno-octulosonic-acid transferase
MLLLYRLIFLIVLILGSPFLFFKALWGKHGITERLGFVPVRKSHKRLFWFHAASVGELKILSSIIPEIKKLIPDLEIAISTTTATGKNRALELFADAIVFHQPLEIYSAIKRTIDNLKPEKLILVETEIWPLLIDIAANNGLKVELINARLSERSYNVYKWFKPFIGQTLRKLDNILAQSKSDAERFMALGARHPIVMGNIKYDQVISGNGGQKKAMILQESHRLVFVAGSIRKGEDRVFADLIARSQEQHLPVFFVLVPRHMKDLDDLTDLLKNREIRFNLWSESRGHEPFGDTVLLVNTMGELTDFYRASDLTFVGGSLIPIGGHDPAEPAALGKPVLFGPYMENARDAARLLLESGGAQIVNDENDLIGFLHKAIENRNILVEKGRLCKESILAMSGVSRKSALIIVGDKA